MSLTPLSSAFTCMLMNSTSISYLYFFQEFFYWLWQLAADNVRKCCGLQSLPWTTLLNVVKTKRLANGMRHAMYEVFQKALPWAPFVIHFDSTEMKDCSDHIANKTYNVASNEESGKLQNSANLDFFFLLLVYSFYIISCLGRTCM